jgi:hypothetical protein
MKNLYFILCAALISSCSVSTKIKTKQNRMNRQAEANAMTTRVVSKPILADIKVGESRVQTTLKTSNQEILGVNEIPKELLGAQAEYIKNEATNRAQFKFMAEQNCDYLVDPIYQYETETVEGSSLISITIEISAYPAYFTKFSQPDSLPKSIFQMYTFNGGRELPLITNAISKQKEKLKREFGFISNCGISNIPLSSSGASLDYNKSGLAAYLGFYSIVPIAGKVGFRSEFSLGTRGYKTDAIEYFNEIYPNYNYTGSGFFKYRYTELAIPTLININFTDNVRLYGGLTFNYFITGKSKREYDVEDAFGNTFQENIQENESIDMALKLGTMVGAEYVLNEKIGVGLRYQSTLSDSWRIFQFSLSAKLN